MRRFVFLLCLLFASSGSLQAQAAAPENAPRHRALVSTDIGGTDFDDFQSMVHLLLYADSLDIEGLIASPYGKGRKQDILTVIDRYEKDYANLKTYSDKYPAPNALRAIAKQGALDTLHHDGFAAPSEGSEWLVQCARRDDPRPLYVLVWGGIDDLAQALHDAPDIVPKIRVYFIGGPNKKWSADAYQYIPENFPKLWIIENNETYSGWFTGGDQAGEWGNAAFVQAHIAGRGALGEYCASVNPNMKMGDSPSVAWLLHGTPEDPSKESWGGQFVRAWQRPHLKMKRLTTAADKIEQFGILELALPLGKNAPAKPKVFMEIENQKLPGRADEKGAIHFRFSPKQAKPYAYTMRGDDPSLDGKTGALTSVRAAPDAASRPDPSIPNWWTDDPSLAAMEGDAVGAKTVARWRVDFLKDFAARLERCKTPASSASSAAALKDPAAKKKAALTEPEKIEKLIAAVEHLEGAVFIRNGDEYSPKDAGEHLRLKQRNAGDKVKTAEQFIDLLASKSSMSGKPYTIRFKDGKTVNSGEFLHGELEKLE